MLQICSVFGAPPPVDPDVLLGVITRVWRFGVIDEPGEPNGVLADVSY